jgi:hypothetical protein
LEHAENRQLTEVAGEIGSLVKSLSQALNPQE